MVPLLAFNLEGNDAKAYLAIGVGAMVLIYLYLRQSFRQKKDPLEKAPFSSLSQQRAVERQMQSLLVEMAEMARQITAQIDTRTEKLHQLMGEADRKIAELRRLQAGGTTQGDAAVQPVSAGSTPSPADSPETRHSEIYSLADAGLPLAEIARRLGRPSGEIELILALGGRSNNPRRVAG